MSLLYLIRGLDRSRFFPTVLCLYESEASELFRKEGIETFVAKGIDDFSHTEVLWYNLLQLPKALYRALRIPVSIEHARRFLEKQQFDIVHLNTSTLTAFGIAAKRMGLKVVWHIREPLHRGYFGIRRNWIRKVIERNADIIIPISQNDADQLLPSEKIHVVYNFIDFKIFDRSQNASHLYDELHIPRNNKVVTMLGGVNQIKGTRVFVEAAKSLHDQYPSVTFLVVGNIPSASFRNRINGSWKYFTALRNIVHSSRLQDCIRFTGNRSDIPAILSITNVLAFPSTVPHFARPIIEASAMGVPVVASNLGGPKELVVEGKTGLLIPPNDPRALAGGMEAILRDENLARRMGDYGVEFAREHFSADRNVNEIISLYSALLHA